MNSRQGKFLALFFAACFLSLQFHPAGEPQSQQNAKQIFHIVAVSTSLIEQGIDNRFIYVLQATSKQVNVSQQKTKLKQQRQFIGAIERQVAHPFRHFMLECLAAICQDYQDKLLTTFNYLQKRELSFEFNPILISTLMQIHSDESDSQISLS